jgi:hypothetical protein
VGAARCIQVVDRLLAARAQAFTVPEFRRLADRLLVHLDPPTGPGDAHAKRYLHLSYLPDGSLVGKFACGPAQALVIASVIAAGSAPQPGLGVDADGIDHVLPDERSPEQRRMDALAEAVMAGATARTASADPADQPDDSDQTDQPQQTEQPQQPEQPERCQHCGSPMVEVSAYPRPGRRRACLAGFSAPHRSGGLPCGAPRWADRAA